MEVSGATTSRNCQPHLSHGDLVAWFEDQQPFEDQPVLDYQKEEAVVVEPVDLMEEMPLVVASVSNSCEGRPYLDSLGRWVSY
jgi:hypothetical protein